MRMPSQKANKKTVNVVKMKQIPVKKKKHAETNKSNDDAVSETISFVIKGKITPLSPTFVSKKTNIGKKELKILGEKNAARKNSKKSKMDIVHGKNIKLPKAKKFKREAAEVKGKLEVQIKNSKKSSADHKNIKKEHDMILPDVIKAELVKIPGKNKSPIVKEKKIYKPKVGKIKIKSEIVEPKSKNTKVVKQQKIIKNDPIDNVAITEEITDKKTKQTIAKLLKQANKALKGDVAKAKEKPKKKSISPVNKDTKSATSIKKPKLDLKKEVNKGKQQLNKVLPKQDNSNKKQTKRKMRNDDSNTNTDDTSTSDELPLDVLRHNSADDKSDASDSNSKANVESAKAAKKKKIVKKEQSADKDKSRKPSAIKQKANRNKQQKKGVLNVKPKMVSIKKAGLNSGKDKVKRKEDQRSRKMKLFNFWNGPKRHRVASLNALAKVHCLYENETRGNIIDNISPIKSEVKVEKKQAAKKEKDFDDIPPTRTLRSVPGLRAIGKHWDMHDSTSSSSDESSTESNDNVTAPKQKCDNNKKTTETKKAEGKRRRNRTEIIMDLKDMVVRKRMASLNATAILAASYSLEKRAVKSPKSDDSTDSYDSDETFTDDSSDKKKCYEADVKKEEDRKLIEVRATPNKKVAVILNQDTDVTITGVYVNSTTRSTHHEGYCSIAGMQYRISATSHTQTAATAVATETLLQSSNTSQESNNCETIPPCKSYTPLDALSNMQPPAGPGTQSNVPAGQHQHVPTQHVLSMPPQHGPQLSPLGRRHGCASAFSAPPSGPYPPPPPPMHHPPPPPTHSEPAYIHGYYQPAGPLITVPHGHSQQHLGKSVPISEPSPTTTPPTSSTHQPPPAPSSTGDSSDNEVIITSVTTAKDAVPPTPHQQPPPPNYRFNQYPTTHPGYSYSYPPHYYAHPPVPPTFSHDLCYSPTPYLHHKYPTYRRYLAPTAQYYPHPPDLYNPPPPPPSQQTQQVVSASPATAPGGTYQPPPPSVPPPPTLLENYPPPTHTLMETYPPQHYYPPYGPAPPPSCYAHSPPARPNLPYLNATYQSCPCPMQSCPKNVLTGPLTGDSKRSTISIIKETVPLPPVALALPLEPASATGPPSPARGSAGMPPPPSPAGATYQPASTPKQEIVELVDCKPVEKRRKARVGKAMVRNNIAANFQQNNTMLLMCHSDVKREVESPKDTTIEQSKEKICELVTVLPPEMFTPTKPTEEPENTQIHEVQTLKIEESEFVTKTVITPPKVETPEITEPCVKTVAENVKVKNMKRKLSFTKEMPKLEPEVTLPLPKKQKLEKYKTPNGSYKNLIKKNTNYIKINNGKRKLHVESAKVKTPKMKMRKSSTKRTLSLVKEEIANKRMKSSKPLMASNLLNLKQNSKENKDALVDDFNYSENKEPARRSYYRKKMNSKTKRLAPDILDSLFAKNSIDRTIDCVVSERVVRTAKETSALRTKNKCKNENKLNTNKKQVNPKVTQVNKSKVECKKIGASKRKTKCKKDVVVAQTLSRIPRRSLQLPRWSNGWTFEGASFEAKVFLNSDETVVVRRCYPAMRHEEGDLIEPRDCVLLKAGPRKNDLPFVAKIAALWENPDDGEMMMSLLWYYRPEHTEQGRLSSDQPDEVFASRHKDSNSVACIEDKCYVLTFNEYCRYRKTLRRLEEGIGETVPSIPIPEPYPRSNRQPPCSLLTSPDMVFFCRRVYDFRQKRIVKNPS